MAWDWLKKIPMWDWHPIQLAGYPGWDRIPGDDEPPRVDMSCVYGQGIQSRDLAVAFDDIAEAAFYYRDFTDDGIPFVREGDVYRSAFWFARFADKERFLRLMEEKRAEL